MAERINYQKENDTQMVADHTYRYWMAFNEIQEYDSVLDCACGYGNGTELMAYKAGLVLGIDNDDMTIELAKKLHPKAKYEVGDLNKLVLPEADVLVCFETIEHLENPSNMVSQFKNFEKVIISVPIKPTKHINKYHIHDFTEKQVRSWFKGRIIKWAKYQHDGLYLVLCSVKK